MTHRSLWHLIDECAAIMSNNTMLVDDKGRSMTFAEYRDTSERVAVALEQRIAERDAVVSWQLPTGIDALVMMAALARLDVVQNPLLPVYGKRELRFILRQVRSSLVVTSSTGRSIDHTARARAVADELGTVEVLEWDTLWADSTRAVRSRPVQALDDDPARVGWVYYTSGTTADPKGVRHSDGALIAAAATQQRALELGPSDAIPIAFPVTHIGGATTLITALMAGCRLLLAEAFDPPQTVAFMRRESATIGTTSTVFHLAYLAEQRKQPGTPILPSVRLFAGGGAPKPPHLHATLVHELGAGIVSSYGMTECPIVTYLLPEDPDDKRATTEGRVGGEARVAIVTTDEQPCSSNAEGEVRVIGPQLFVGYVDESLNADAFDANGYFRTGDLGYLDDDGYLTITGRLKDVIIRKGENISAKEVEDLLFRHPKIRDVAVVGVPDPERGERCYAVVTVIDPADPFTFAEMIDFLRQEELMPQKWPEQLELVPELPRNATGKVLKQELRRRYTDA